MKSLSSYVYDVERFGFSPAKLWSRFFKARSSLPKIITVTIPKSGTHLLQRVLVLHPMLYRRMLPTLGRRNREIWSDLDRVFKKTKPGEIISAHFDYSEHLENYLTNEVGHKVIFLVRDPRDIVISAMYYILKKPNHGYRERLIRMRSKKEMLAALITGNEVILPIDREINRFIGWANPRVHCVKFEDLAGAAADGNDQKQRKSIRQLYEYLGMEIDNDLLEYIASNCRSPKTQTYRTGRINNWREEFDGELKALFKRIGGKLLIDMGYENDLSW